MSSQAAFISLWTTVALNFVVGGVIWLSQREELDSYKPDPEAYAWSTVGTNLMGFAILVAVVALATHAIVAAIEENSRSR
jgi:hypothetical protein